MVRVLAAMAPSLPACALQERALLSVLGPSSSTVRDTRWAQNAATGHWQCFGAASQERLLSKSGSRGVNARGRTKCATAEALEARSTVLDGPSHVSYVDSEAVALPATPMVSSHTDLAPIPISQGPSHTGSEVAEGGTMWLRGTGRTLLNAALDASVNAFNAVQRTLRLAAPVLALLSLLVPKSAIAATAQSLSKGAASGAASVPLRLSDISGNAIFMSALIAWAMAQSLKVFTTWWSLKVLDWRMLFASGGMPSSHSAMCCGITTSVALLHGFAGPLFPICLAFTLIVMYDATSVRYHAGVQAKVLNVVVEEMLQGHPVSEKKLKELLGHTPLQVAAGATLGVVVAILFNRGGLWL